MGAGGPKRKKQRAVFLKDGEIIVAEGKEAIELHDKYIKEESSNSQEVKGIIGFQGKIIGKVTIIKSIYDKNKFTKGNILVTHDGTAELTYFLKQAGAIVTDQGGMISHAAIVAREMNIPAILGTKVEIKHSPKGGKIEINYYSLDDFDRLIEIIGNS